MSGTRQYNTGTIKWVLDETELSVINMDRGSVVHIPKAEFARFLVRAKIVHSAVLRNGEEVQDGEAAQ